MDIRAEFSDLSRPNDLLALKKILSELGDTLDIIYTTSAPNGSISARQGRRALYLNGSSYELWVNTDGATTWVQITNQSLWEIDGTETQLKTADEIDMQSKQIINVLDPVNDQDAATKKHVADKFDTSTGHDHDGSDSKKVLATNLDATGITSGHVLYNNSGTISGKAEANTSNSILNYMVETSGGGGGAVTIGHFRFKKIAGISTVTIQARLKNAQAGRAATVDVHIDPDTLDLSADVTRTDTAYGWATSDTIDVSSLSDGTTYDAYVTLAGEGGYDASLSGLSLIGS